MSCLLTYSSRYQCLVWICTFVLYICWN